jgi:hypothetical protein
MEGRLFPFCSVNRRIDKAAKAEVWEYYNVSAEGKMRVFAFIADRLANSGWRNTTPNKHSMKSS